MIIWRKATEADMHDVFTMGYDEWGEGNTLEQHIEKCLHSKKYEKGQWYVLEDQENKRLVSSLIAYDLHAPTDPVAKGLGTVATAPHARKKGFGSRLIEETIKGLKQEGCHHLFLYSDIAIEFYERHGFMVLPQKYQKYKDTVCMYYQGNDALDLERFTIPKYF